MVRIPHRRTRGRARIALAVVLLGLPACTDDTTSSQPATAPSETPPAPTEASPSPEPSASRRVRSVVRVREYDVPAGPHPHDVAPAPDGSVWYTAQGSGELGSLDPKTGATRHIPLGDGSAPHGVIVGPDGAPWITDGGLNAIVRVDPDSERVTRFPLPTSTYANLNTGTFDGDGILWFTGQSGVYGRVDPGGRAAEVWESPGGEGPHGIATTPDGNVYYASLAGSHIARIGRRAGESTVI